MLWALISSVFVIYLYRALNAAGGARTSDELVPANAIDAELTKLNSRIDAIESMASGKARGTTP
jgi:hypothetical protein